MKKIVILGSEGYIGTSVVDFLSTNKTFKIIGLDNLIYSQKNKLKTYINYDFKKIDIRNLKKTSKICKDAYCVIILAGLVGDPITKKYKKLSNLINLVAIKKLIKELNSQNIKKLIFVSTCSNYGIKKNKLLKETAKLNPISFYSKQKVEIEKYLLNNTFKFSKTILRFATAFGLSRRMRFDLTINEFVKTAFYNETLEIYHGNTYRPYCHVKDFGRIIYKMIKAPINKIDGEIFNCGSNSNNFSKIQISNFLKKKYHQLRIKKVSVNLDLRNYRVDFEKIKKFMNSKKNFVSINYGIKEISHFLKKNRDLNFIDYGNYKIIKK